MKPLLKDKTVFHFQLLIFVLLSFEYNLNPYETSGDTINTAVHMPGQLLAVSFYVVTLHLIMLHFPWLHEDEDMGIFKLQNTVLV